MDVDWSCLVYGPLPSRDYTHRLRATGIWALMRAVSSAKGGRPASPTESRALIQEIQRHPGLVCAPESLVGKDDALAWASAAPRSSN